MSFPLDTLAQLPPTSLSTSYGVAKNAKSQKRFNFQKKARSKYFSHGLVFKMVDIKSSPLIKSYWNTFHCCGVLEQKNEKLTGKYCGNRWCLTCNRVRTAKMINGYSQSINEMQRPYFVTLTVPNVKGKALRETIQEMTMAVRTIKKKLFRMNVDITGIRKLECTFNDIRNDFHPHFHFLISGRIPAMLLVNAWLKEFSNADRKGQDYKRADGKAVKELFKYFTKLVVKTYDKKSGQAVRKKVQVNALDTIFNAIKGMRVYQPMGIVKYQAEFSRFIGKIKNTYEERKNAIVMMIQNDENVKVNAVFTATMQYNENDFSPGNVDTDILMKFKGKPGELERYQWFNAIINRADFSKYDAMEKLCFEIKFTGVNMPEKFKKMSFRTFYKHEAVQWFTDFYTNLNGINITEEIEELFSQKVEGLTKDSTRWLWHKNDWFDIETGEVLCNYDPSIEMQKIVESIEVEKTELTKTKTVTLWS